MISWTWRIGSAYSSLPSVKTTSWRVVASVGMGLLRENWKCAPVIGLDGRLLSRSEALVGKKRRPLHAALAAHVRRSQSGFARRRSAPSAAARARGRGAAAPPARRARRAAGRPSAGPRGRRATPPPPPGGGGAPPGPPGPPR